LDVGVSDKLGIPLLETFLANLKTNSVEDYVIPLPLDSLSACELIGLRGIKANLIHIDAGHHFHSVYLDLLSWWEVLEPNGWIVCDDYNPQWPGVVQAVDDFLKTVTFHKFHSDGVKCAFQKAIGNGSQMNLPTSQTLLNSRESSENQFLRDQYAYMSQRVYNLENSLSWRVTNPARLLLGFLYRLIK
jgi:Methyltransferase domain